MAFVRYGRRRNKTHKRHGDVRRLNPDGTLREIIRVSKPRPKPTTKTQAPPKLTERQTDQYNDWRRAVLRRDGRKCVLCGRADWLNVHHIVRWIDSDALRYEPTNGVTLCIPCHCKHHGPDNAPFPAYITEKLTKYIEEVENG